MVGHKSKLFYRTMFFFAYYQYKSNFMRTTCFLQ